MIHYFKGFIHLPKRLSLLEKISVIGLIVVALISAILWWKNLTELWLVKPVHGGTYTEGLIDTSPQELELLTAKLTKIGLTYVDHNRAIKGALAERWEIQGDGKQYTFYLKNGVDAAEIQTIYSALPQWQNIDIAVGENNSVVMTLKQAFSPLLSFTSDPVIDLGPYKLEKQSQNEIIFTANRKFILGEPYLGRIILTFYPDERSLRAALQRQEIMGADRKINDIVGTKTKKLKLTKQNVLFFNLEKAPFNDKKLREQIINNRLIDPPVSVTLVTNQESELLTLANNFAERVKTLGVDVSIKSVNPVILERDIVPSENYDLFLTSINYGYDQDPYPFWHSSQVIAPGQNYAGYISKEADKLIEEARQTLDQKERQKKYESFQSILKQDMPAIFYPNDIFEYTVSSRIRGLSEGTAAVSADRFTEVWKWFIKAKKERN